jgi:hypothetical protein
MNILIAIPLFIIAHQNLGIELDFNLDRILLFLLMIVVIQLLRLLRTIIIICIFIYILVLLQDSFWKLWIQQCI